MPAVSLGASAFKRRDARLPETYALNLVVAQDPTNAIDGLMRFQRPGLTSFAQPTANPNRGIYRQEGAISGDFLVVAGQYWYRVNMAGASTLLGTVAGSDRVQMASLAAKAFCVATGLVYSTDGTTVSSVAMPDGRLVQSVEELNGYIILSQKDSARFYWIAPGETVPDPLSYATAERSPSSITGLAVINDTLWIFKPDNIEVWQPTGDADAPFQRITGRVFDKGCSARDGISKLDNTLYWPGTDGNAYRADSNPVVISDDGVSERLRKCVKADIRAWTWTLDGGTYYALNLGAEGTWVFCLPAQKWSRFGSYEYDYWRCHMGATGSENMVIGADSETGELWRLDPTVSNDDGVVMEREITGGVPVVGKPERCDSLTLSVGVGWAPDPSYEPKLLISWSDNQGATYEDPEIVGLGKTGNYDRDVFLTKLGMMQPPGRLFKIRMTDDAIFRLSYARYNEAFAYGS